MLNKLKGVIKIIMKNKFTVWEANINDSTLKFLEENFKFEEEFLNIGKHLLNKRLVVLNHHNKPVSVALVDKFSKNQDVLIAKEIIARFYDKIMCLEETLEINKVECGCIKNEIEQLTKDVSLFKENSFYYIFYLESNEKNKGYASLLVSYLKDKYKYISALPMNNSSLKVFTKNKFKDIEGFNYAISGEDEKLFNNLILEMESPFLKY